MGSDTRCSVGTEIAETARLVMKSGRKVTSFKVGERAAGAEVALGWQISARPVLVNGFTSDRTVSVVKELDDDVESVPRVLMPPVRHRDD